MSMTYSKADKVTVDVSELAQLRDALVEEQHRVSRVLAQIDKVLGGEKDSKHRRAGVAEVTGIDPARPSPLDRVTAVMAATADLREGNGNLSAMKVAKLFGVSLSQLAGWLGRSKQAISKTPDADSLQNALGYFERVSRLRLITKSDGQFRKWLRTPHPDVDGSNPLELMANGEWQAMADFVEDILTGTPG